MIQSVEEYICRLIGMIKTHYVEVFLYLGLDSRLCSLKCKNFRAAAQLKQTCSPYLMVQTLCSDDNVLSFKFT